MKLKDAYKEQIEIHFWIELGLQLHLGKYFHDLLEKYPFDFVIGSSTLCTEPIPTIRNFFRGAL